MDLKASVDQSVHKPSTFPFVQLCTACSFMLVVVEYYHNYSHHRSKYRIIHNFCHFFFSSLIFFYTSQCVLKTAIRVSVKTKGSQRNRGWMGLGGGTRVMVFITSGATLGPPERMRGWSGAMTR